MNKIDAWMQEIDVWISESFQLAQKSVYQDPPIGPYKISKAYQVRSLDIAKQRIWLAGSRMAALFNELLGER